MDATEWDALSAKEQNVEEWPRLHCKQDREETKEVRRGISLEVRWLRLCFPMQGVWV